MAKFRKGQRCYPLSRDHSLEEAPHSSKTGLEKVRTEDRQEIITSSVDSKIPPTPHAVDKTRDACPPLAPPESDISQCLLRLHSPPHFPFMTGGRYSHPSRQPVIGVLSTELPLPPVFWPIIQQHSSTMGAHTSPVTKNCSLSLQTACPSKAGPHPHLGL